MVDGLLGITACQSALVMTGLTVVFFTNHRPKRSARYIGNILAGNQNYDQLSTILGMSRGTVRNVLENPIYTGWLVIDEKRDLSPAAKRVGSDGRRRDRRKIKRAPEEVIRQRVIEEPLIAQSDFDRVQYLIRQKAEHAIRIRRKVGHFTYNGFLWCSKCGARLHTFRNQFQRHYYICSGKKRKDEAGNFLFSTVVIEAGKSWSLNLWTTF